MLAHRVADPHSSSARPRSEPVPRLRRATPGPWGPRFPVIGAVPRRPARFWLGTRRRGGRTAGRCPFLHVPAVPLARFGVEVARSFDVRRLPRPLCPCAGRALLDVVRQEQGRQPWCGQWRRPRSPRCSAHGPRCLGTELLHPFAVGSLVNDAGSVATHRCHGLGRMRRPHGRTSSGRARQSRSLSACPRPRRNWRARSRSRGAKLLSTHEVVDASSSGRRRPATGGYSGIRSA